MPTAEALYPLFVNKRVTATLVLTFVALVGATAWVPTLGSPAIWSTGSSMWGGAHDYCWAWEAAWPAPPAPSGENSPEDLVWRGRMPPPNFIPLIAVPEYLTQVGAVVVLGGLLALYVRTRREAA